MKIWMTLLNCILMSKFFESDRFDEVEEDGGKDDGDDDLAQLSDDVFIKVGRVKLICLCNCFGIILRQLKSKKMGINFIR